MATVKKPSAAAQARILTLLEAWLGDPAQRKRLEELIASLPAKKLAAAAKVATEGPEEMPGTLKKYLEWFRAERSRRMELLRTIAPRRDVEQMEAALKQVGRRLSSKEHKHAFKDAESLATYLATLSVAQLETYKEALEEGVLDMPANVKKTLLKLFAKLQAEQFAREQDWMKTVGPLAGGVAEALEIQQRIDMLEKIQSSLRLT